ncbi:hypothetical protein GCM10020254_03280 [Streptomyces goshikiensis]
MLSRVERGAGVLFAGPQDGADRVGAGQQLRQRFPGLQARGAQHRGGVHQRGQGGQEHRELRLVHQLGETRILPQVTGRPERRQGRQVAPRRLAAAAVVDVGRLRSDHRGGDHDTSGEEGGAVARRPARRLARPVGGVGAQVDQRPPRERSGGAAEDFVHRPVVGEAEDHEVARLDRPGGRRRERGAVGHDAGGPAGGAVPHGDRVTGVEEGARHRLAHGAESDHGDGAVLAGGGVLGCVHPSMLGERR